MVSVIIPNYNHARFLDERIQSVLDQTYQDFEVIILDDCSTDNSLEVINQYRNHPKISTIVVNEKNSGSPFKQWQKGIMIAHGEIIWIAESDDSCEPTILEQLVKNLEKHNAVLAFCRSKQKDDRGRDMENDFQDIFTGDMMMEGTDFINKYLVHDPYVTNISSAIFRKEAAMSLTLPYTDFRGAGDWVFSVGMAQKGAIFYLNMPLNYYRFHQSSTTNQEVRSGNGAKEIKKVIDLFLENGIINDSQFRQERLHRLRQIFFSGYSKQMYEELVKMWGITWIEKQWLKFLGIYNTLLLVKKIVK